MARGLTLAAIAGAAAAAAVTAQQQYKFYYTDAGDCDPPGTPACRPSEIPQLNLKIATFDSKGTLLATVNATQLYNGMGYLSLHPDGQRLLFATQDESPDGIVRTWLLNVSSSADPVIILDDLTNLLTPCAPTCVSASTFHATWTADGSGMVFAYRVWDQDGNGIGSQGLASAAADGSAIKVLTWTTAGTYQGLNIIDTCPSPVPNDPNRVLFVRTTDQGASDYLAVVDVTTSNSSQLLQLPQWSDSSGCPNAVPTPDGLTSIVMLCDDGCGFEAQQKEGEEQAVVAVKRADVGAAWGRVPSAAAARMTRKTATPNTAWPNYYASITQTLGQDPSTWGYTKMFPVPFVNTTDYDDTYGITQCDAIHVKGQATAPSYTLNCQGASPAYETFQYLFVDPATGNSTANSYNTILACMTPRCTTMAAVQGK